MLPEKRRAGRAIRKQRRIEREAVADAVGSFSVLFDALSAMFAQATEALAEAVDAVLGFAREYERDVLAVAEAAQAAIEEAPEDDRVRFVREALGVELMPWQIPYLTAVEPLSLPPISRPGIALGVRHES